MKKIATFTCVVKDMFYLQSKTFSQVLATVIMQSILHFQMYSKSLNGEYKTVIIKLFLQFVYSKKDK